MLKTIEALDEMENFRILFKQTVIPARVLEEKGDIEPKLELSESTDEPSDIARYNRGRRRFHGIKKLEPGHFVSKRLPYVRATEKNWRKEIDGSNGYHSDSECVSGDGVSAVRGAFEVASTISLDEFRGLRGLQQFAFKNEWEKIYDPKDTRGGA